MAIIKSCCCWRSLRTGCYACAFYMWIYNFLSVILFLGFIYEERAYYLGKNATPGSLSVLEPRISSTTMLFQVLGLILSLLGIVTSIVLAYGIYKDIKLLLIPWILTVISTQILDVAYTVNLIVYDEIAFNPVTAILYTFDFFLLCLNLYCLLCVISQYQEYISGRGTSEFCQSLPIRFINRPVATITTYDSSRLRPTSATDLPSPGSADSTDKSQRKHIHSGKKCDISSDFLHANWKETNSSSSKVTEDETSSLKISSDNPSTTDTDTAPLISMPNPTLTDTQQTN